MMPGPKVKQEKWKDRTNRVLLYYAPGRSRPYTKSAGTPEEAEAERKAGEWAADIKAGRWSPGRRKKKGGGFGAHMPWDAFRGYFDRHFTGRKGRKPARETWRKHWVALDLFESAIGPRELADFTTSNVTAYATWQGNRSEQSTVACRLRHLRVVANWAHRQGGLPELPLFDMPETGDSKGRPLVGEEFDRMLAACDDVCGLGAASYREFLTGLWWSGLRLGEALSLRWGPQDDGVRVVLAGRRTKLHFDAASQKNRKAGACPVAPEFVQFLDALPRRRGYVFHLETQRGAPMSRATDGVGKRITAIGRAAGVVVNAETAKTASAHDLRRSFGKRWRRRLTRPTDLMQLMRHANIETTLRYYDDLDADETNDAVWGWASEHEAGNQQTDQQPGVSA